MKSEMKSEIKDLQKEVLDLKVKLAHMEGKQAAQEAYKK